MGKPCLDLQLFRIGKAKVGKDITAAVSHRDFFVGHGFPAFRLAQKEPEFDRQVVRDALIRGIRSGRGNGSTLAS